MVETVKAPARQDTAWTNVEAFMWSLDGDDSGQMIEMAKYSDKTVHIYGTFDSASITLYGSNDPLALVDKAAGTLFANKTASWVALTDPQGNAITKTAAAIEAVLENPLYILPVASGGGGSSAVKVVIAGKKTI